MTCTTCKQQTTEGDAIRRARAFSCQLCIYAEHDPVSPWIVGAVTCTISGKPVEAHITACKADCPKGRHDGVVRFPFWFKRAGIPKELRWLFAWWLTGPMPGCGCFVFLLKLRSWLSRIHSSVATPRSGKPIDLLR